MTYQPKSEAERVALMSEEVRERWWKGKGAEKQYQLHYDWSFWQRSDQQPPKGDWRCWFVMAGRGFGKTRMAAEWVRAHAEADGSQRIALVAATMAEARAIMVEGESGLLTIAPDERRPVFEPSNRRLVWANGAVATLFTAAEPDGLRGPEHSLAWGDEIAKWDNGIATWNNLSMTMRVGLDPRVIATSTPRPLPLVRRLMTEKGVVVTGGTTKGNRANMPTSFLQGMQSVYGGTRVERQELLGELIADAEGALWTRDLIEKCRVAVVPEMKRIVIGVDPPASSGGDACGIIVGGMGRDGRAYVLADCSVEKAAPAEWARAVASAAGAWGADRVVAEANNGGEMVEQVLRNAEFAMPVKRVHASRGKVARAEPVSTLFENGRARFAGAFPALEDELCGLVIGGGYQGPGRSPDRADACVWAVTELMKGERGSEARVRWL